MWLRKVRQTGTTLSAGRGEMKPEKLPTDRLCGVCHRELHRLETHIWSEQHSCWACYECTRPGEMGETVRLITCPECLGIGDKYSPAIRRITRCEACNGSKVVTKQKSDELKEKREIRQLVIHLREAAGAEFVNNRLQTARLMRRAAEVIAKQIDGDILC